VPLVHGLGPWCCKINKQASTASCEGLSIQAAGCFSSRPPPDQTCREAHTDRHRVVMCTTKFQLLGLGHLSPSDWNLASQRLVEYTGGIEGPERCPSGPRKQNEAERNSRWCHQTHLLTEKGFQAAIKRHVVESPGRHNFFRRSIRSKPKL
jgi:hypothetical protein